VLIRLRYAAEPPSVPWNVLTEFRASSLGYMDKTVMGATVVRAVRIRGHRGYWLAGAPHE